MEVRGKNRREKSPERVHIQMHDHTKAVTRVIKPQIFKKVQVVYYLSKNGQLEHPHFMEVTHLAHQHLRLKDVMDRLRVLRGRGMPALYSWSYKRSYRNGYVWNDLAENDDIISPSDGAEYILKGSQLLNTSYTEKYQVVQDPNMYHAKRKSVRTKRHGETQEYEKNIYEDDEEYYEEKASYTAPNTPYSRCSIGVSTDDIELQLQETKITNKISSNTESTQHNSSPPSATSSSISDKAVNDNNSKRFEEGDLVGTESVLSRNSVLYSLIACGGSVSFRGNNNKEEAARKSGGLHKGLLCKSAAATVAAAAAEEDYDEDVIRCMSENPRFGNLQAEEKEYFSGSIVEAMCGDERVKVVVPLLKKSSSYNEERSCKSGLDVVGGEEKEEKKRKEERDGGKGKCIPRSKKCSTSCLSSFI